MRHRNVWIVAAAVGALFGAGALLGQAGFGVVTGLVKDVTGSVVPGVSVTVSNQDTGSRVTVASQENGAYRTPQLPPGTYTVSVQHGGFKSLTVTGLKLDVDSMLTQDLPLEVGGVTESVQVVAQTAPVESASGAAGTNVSLTQVQEFALADRNVYRLVSMVPGATLSNASGQAAGTPVFVAGSRGWSVANTIDGIRIPIQT